MTLAYTVNDPGQPLPAYEERLSCATREGTRVHRADQSGRMRVACAYCVLVSDLNTALADAELSGRPGVRTRDTFTQRLDRKGQ